MRDAQQGRSSEPFIIKYPMAPHPERRARSDGAEFPHPDGHRCPKRVASEAAQPNPWNFAPSLELAG